MDNDTYTVLVKFERSIGEDIELAEAKFPNLPLEEALARQLVEELQEACDNGMAGFFEVGAVSLPPGVEV